MGKLTFIGVEYDVITMNFHSHYMQQWVNKRSKKAYKSGRILKWLHHYKSSYLRWVKSVKELNLPSISGWDLVPQVVNYNFTYEE